MGQDKIKENLEKALDSETFDVLDYLEGQPVATDEVVIYTDVVRARRFHELNRKREDALALRAYDQEQGKATNLSLAESDDSTEFDEELEDLRKGLKETALTFVIRTVSPAKVSELSEKSRAKFKGDWDDAEQVEEYNTKLGNDILALAIDHVVRGDGVKDDSKWTGTRLQKLENVLYPQQAQKLSTALNDLVFTGAVFDEALTSDF